jgi:predicted P-loop ATPase
MVGSKKIDDHSNSSTIQMIRFLLSKYEFKNNVILNEIVAREKGKDTFEAVNPNTLYIEARAAGYRTSIGEINIFLCSDYIPKTNPFDEYFVKIASLWNEATDGDYIQRFSEYIQVTDQKRFAFQFKKWLVRCVACALEKEYFNKQALIFVQETQHGGKTTLTRFLIPGDLTEYCTENISVDKDSLIALCQNFGVIQDELSTLSKVEINAQKTLMSKSYIKVRHPYDRKPKLEPRRASIWGSTNKDEFLTDETGSVRWLCFNISDINFAYKTDIDINKVWSQAYHLYACGFKYEMTTEEIMENERANHHYKTLTVEAELLHKYYGPATEVSYECFLTATEISTELTILTESKIRINPVEVGKALKMLGFHQGQRRGHGTQRFPVKGYYLYKNPPTTYYNESK